MERARTLATMAAALLVGAAAVILWPRPQLPPALQPQPEPAPATTEEPSAASESASQTVHTQPDHLELLRHLTGARAAWLDLAEQAEAAPDAATRALAPTLAGLAAMVPEAEPHPLLQPTAALLVAELQIADELEDSSLDATALLQEIRAIRALWIGELPVAATRDPR